MLGIDWGYATWSQARLQAAAQPLALASFWGDPYQGVHETIMNNTMRLHSSTKIEKTFSVSNAVHVQISESLALPLPSFSLGNHFNEKEFSRDVDLSTAKNRSSSRVMSERQFEVVGAAEAKLHPARQVGMSRAGRIALNGAIPCVLAREFWEMIPVDETIMVPVDSLGQMIGQDRKIGQFNQILTSIGQTVDAPNLLDTSKVHLEGYVPIFQTVGGRDRVVGFGRVNIDGTNRQVAITKHVTKTSSQNASTQLVGDISELNQEELVQVFALNHTLKDAVLASTLM